MDFSLAMAAYAISTMKHEAHSALPDAPVVAPRPTGRMTGRLASLKGWSATVLHRIAWALEPRVPAAPETTRRNTPPLPGVACK